MEQKTGRRTVHLRQSHVVDELQRLVPGARVSGGTFGHWLPPPAAVRRDERASILDEARRAATSRCLKDLLVGVGLPATVPDALAGGGRVWPQGHTGSVSHKGTTVVATIAHVERFLSVGIDIETLDTQDLSGIPGLVAAAETPPALPDGQRLGALFSAKEAIFKAAYPVCRRRLEFGDVTVDWAKGPAQGLVGSARYDDVEVQVRCSVAIPTWAVAIAVVLP